MKLLEQTPYRLSFLDRALLPWVFGIVFSSLLGPFIMSFGTLLTLACERNLSALECQISRTSLFGLVAKQTPVHHLQKARVDQHRSSLSKGRLHYKVVLLTETEKIDFGSIIGIHFVNINPSRSADAIASQINDSINDPNQRSLIIRQDSRLLTFAAGSIFIGLGLLVLLSAEVTYCSLDKMRGSLLIKHRGIFKAQTIEYSLTQVTSAKWETLTSTAKGKTTTTYRIAFILTSGEHIPLTNYYSSCNILDNSSEMIELISAFLRTH